MTGAETPDGYLNSVTVLLRIMMLMYKMEKRPDWGNFKEEMCMEHWGVGGGELMHGRGMQNTHSGQSAGQRLSRRRFRFSTCQK